jgi:hypothetical protein
MSDRRPDINIATSEELAALAAGGDGHAFARLVRLNGEAMTRVAWLVTGNMPAAVDAVRAAWVAAWVGIRKRHEPAALDAWLCTLAAVEAERVVHMALEDLLPPGRPSWSGESAIDLGRLLPADRSLLALHHLVGLAPDELDTLLERGAGRRVWHRAPRPTRRAAVRLADAWAAVGLDAVRAAERIPAMAAVPVWPVDADAIARLARSEEGESRLRIASALVGLAAGVIVAMLPLLAELAASGR